MKTSKLFDQLVAKSWWTILFVLICLFTYDLSSRKKLQTQRSLQEKLATLEESVHHAKKEQLLMQQQIAAQDDPDWIELMLMRKLGLVPENQTKILFK